MKMIAQELIRIAKAVARTEIVFPRPKDEEDHKINVVHYEVSRFLDTIRKNEKLETFIDRSDDEDGTKLEIGLSDHEEMEAIVREIEALAEKVAKKHDVDIKKD